MDSNRTAVGIVEEVTFGTTPANPAIESLRIKGSDLRQASNTGVSNEIRADRQVTDLIRLGTDVNGTIPFEFSYSSYDTPIQGAFFSVWVNKAVRTNIGAADNITAVSTTAYTVLANPGTQLNNAVFAANMLVQAAGFTNAGNNRLFVAAAGTSGTSVAMTAGTVEAAPPAAARLKAIGFAASAAADVQAGANGLTSTTTNFTTFGLQVGEWVKVGGTATVNKFATLFNNGWCRISSITATALNFDVKPTGWAVDAAAGVTLYVFFGDTLRNGTTKKSYTLEEQFQDLAVPEFNYYRGMIVSQLQLQAQAEAILEGSIAFLGLTSANVTARLAGATDKVANTNDVMNTSACVGQVYEGGAAVPGTNYVMGMTLTIDNSLRGRKALGSATLVDIGIGRVMVTGTLDLYYGSNAILTKILNGTASSFSTVLSDDTFTKGYVLDLPRIKYNDGNPDVPGVDTDRTLKTKFTAMRDPNLGYTVQLQRFEQYQQ